jgi:UDP-GlcNAc:undecaprenyl-phosphate GlcNAc-1-phosphate transferase
MPFLLPFAISFVITGLMVRLAPFLKLVDIPSPRKVHTRPIPKGGGLAIFAGWMFTLSAVHYRSDWRFDRSDLAVLSTAGLMIFVLGLVDDIRPLPWQLRLGVQFIAAVWAVNIGRIPSGTWTLAVIWIVGLTNAFNMLDNMDALSGGVALIVAGFFAAFTSGLFPFLMLMGALLGFLWFNYPPARIFMGDAGSTFLGFAFGTSSLRLGITVSEETITWESISASWALILCFLTIPWYDLVSVVTIRLSQGRSPFHGDKQHLSHRLVALGLSPPLAVGTICYLALVVGLGGVAIRRRLNTESYWLWVYVAGCWLALASFDYLTRKIRQTKIEVS